MASTHCIRVSLHTLYVCLCKSMSFKVCMCFWEGMGMLGCVWTCACEQWIRFHCAGMLNSRSNSCHTFSFPSPWQIPRFPHNTFLMHYWSWTLYGPTYSVSRSLGSIGLLVCLCLQVEKNERTSERATCKPTVVYPLVGEDICLCLYCLFNGVFKEIRILACCIWMSWLFHCLYSELEPVCDGKSCYSIST